MTPSEIKDMRLRAEQSQANAARSVCVTERTWQRYEAGTTKMPLGLIRLYKLLTKD